MKRGKNEEKMEISAYFVVSVTKKCYLCKDKRVKSN